MAPAPSPTVAAVLVAGGSSRRMGGEPKQFRLLAGRSVLERAAAALRAHPAVRRIVAVVPEDEQERVLALLATVQGVEVAAGGASRRDSVAAGLAALAGDPPELVLIHDAARPVLPPSVINRLIGALTKAEGACPVLPLADTLVAREGETLGAVTDRNSYWRVQTPQAFRYSAIWQAHEGWSGDEPTDDAQMLRHAGGRVRRVEGDERLVKLTWEADFARMEATLGQRVSVTGSGFDVHRLKAGQELWLCGLRIEHHHGLSGHSDADVGLHALTDALLGAIGAGDIGDHFPPSDERWRGARSDQFLAHAARLAREGGARLEHLDVTLICEEPKIGPHKAAMRQRIAEIVDVAVGCVSVKATTTEALGFTGRGEGIAAQAVVTLSRVAEDFER